MIKTNPPSYLPHIGCAKVNIATLSVVFSVFWGV
jgi:hypothetical protein